jgi:hypothetical protein
MKRLLIVAALLAAGGGASAQQPSQQQPIRYWFVWPDSDSTVWSRVQQWVPVQADAVRCVLQEERTGLTWDGFAYLPGKAPPVRVDTVTVVRVDTVYVDTTTIPPDTTTVPPDTTTVPPASAVALSATETLTNFGRDVEVFVRDSLGSPIQGHAVRFEISGGQFGNGTCCVFNRTSTSNGRTVVGWQNYGAGDALTVTAAGADTLRILAPDSAAPAPPPGPPTPPPMPPPPADSTNRTPAGLFYTLGPTITATGSAPFGRYDQRYIAAEQASYDHVAVGQTQPQPRPGETAATGMHYGALVSRLMWSTRHGLPLDATNAIYSHGVDAVRWYLQWTKKNSFNMQPHNNTGMFSIEALYLLEGDPDALTHLHVNAQCSTTDPWGYQSVTNLNGGWRIPAISLQVFTIARRLGIPYVRNQANTSCGFNAGLGSWDAAGAQQVQWMLAAEQRRGGDGSLESPVHSKVATHGEIGTTEAYFINALAARALLVWFRDTGDRVAYDLAMRIISHLADEVSRKGVRCLPYLSNKISQSDVNGESRDTAGFYPWIFAVAWQETGEQRYADAALTAIECAQAAYLGTPKQWNETYGDMWAQGAEALLAGVPWR